VFYDRKNDESVKTAVTSFFSDQGERLEKTREKALATMNLLQFLLDYRKQAFEFMGCNESFEYFWNCTIFEYSLSREWMGIREIGKIKPQK